MLVCGIFYLASNLFAFVFETGDFVFGERVSVLCSLEREGGP